MTTDSAGNANFTLTLPNPIPGGQFVTATATDPNNNTSEFSQGLAVTTMADLALSATGIPNPVVQGNDLTYTLTVTNGGTAPTVRTTLTDTLPSGVTLVSATGSPSQSGNTLTFALGTLSPGASTTITIIVQPSFDIVGPITNTASVTTSTPDSNPSNNTASVTTVVRFSFTVTNMLDTPSNTQSVPGSLRRAIENVLADTSNPDIDTIDFKIPGSGPFTILPVTPLPEIVRPVIIDATTQPGFQGHPIVVLNGSLAGVEADGLDLVRGHSTVRGLVVNSFSNVGIVLGNPQSLPVASEGGDVLEGNSIGTDVTGTFAMPNLQGVLILGTMFNRIGGTAPGAGNVISGNTSAGLQIFNSVTIVDTSPPSVPLTRRLQPGAG